MYKPATGPAWRAGLAEIKEKHGPSWAVPVDQSNTACGIAAGHFGRALDVGRVFHPVGRYGLDRYRGTSYEHPKISAVTGLPMLLMVAVTRLFFAPG